jgi:protocatechuate 3,4-dioxygenase beta subunit
MDERTHADDGQITRRSSLVKLGGFVATALVAGGCKADSSESTTDATAGGAGPAGVASGAVKCVLTPEQTEGPYYIADEKVRRNIIEGRPGMPLALRLGVVDASTCRPIKGAAVDIWHCDAGGSYSGYTSMSSGGPAAGGAQNEPTDELTFLRGIQRTDAKGIATFQTIYPGWYAGRTVHIHVKVHLGGNVLHTGQLYFPDRVTDAVYRKAPYRQRVAGRTTRNANDSVYRNGGSKSMVSLRRNGSGYVGTITMGVQRS